jgi:hypothetical protein
MEEELGRSECAPAFRELDKGHEGVSLEGLVVVGFPCKNDPVFVLKLGKRSFI